MQHLEEILFKKNFNEYDDITKMNNKCPIPKTFDAVFAYLQSESFKINTHRDLIFKKTLVQKTIISIKNVLKLIPNLNNYKSGYSMFQIIINSTDTFEKFLEKKSVENIRYVILSIN